MQPQAASNNPAASLAPKWLSTVNAAIAEAIVVTAAVIAAIAAVAVGEIVVVAVEIAVLVVVIAKLRWEADHVAS
jgi:hypothetical protein